MLLNLLLAVLLIPAGGVRGGPVIPAPYHHIHGGHRGTVQTPPYSHKR